MNLLFEIYRRLFETMPVESVSNPTRNTILYPLGVANLPPETVQESENVRLHMLSTIRTYFSEDDFPFDEDRPYPLVIYPLLSNEWTNSKPAEQWYPDYKEQLYHAVNWLNAAEVSHNDLLPRNVMWRVTKDNRLELKLIDFEHSCFFNDYIKTEFVSACQRDPRYPFNISADGLAIGGKEHNDSFCKNIKAFMKSKEIQFYEFMDSHRRTVSPKTSLVNKFRRLMNNK
jgi:hypothetical protein